VNPPLVIVGTSYTYSTTDKVLSSSMEPTLHCARPGPGCEATVDDLVVVQHPPGNPTRGEIVIFQPPPSAALKCGAGGFFIKRIVGLPGERLENRVIGGNGYVFIDGKRLDEPYIQTDRRVPSTHFGPVTIPAGHYFMLGDNRAFSCDSRFWGSVARANITGTITKIIREA
jgi:signal peptidase I